LRWGALLLLLLLPLPPPSDSHRRREQRLSLNFFHTVIIIASAAGAALTVAVSFHIAWAGGHFSIIHCSIIAVGGAALAVADSFSRDSLNFGSIADLIDRSPGSRGRVPVVVATQSLVALTLSWSVPRHLAIIAGNRPSFQ